MSKIRKSNLTVDGNTVHVSMPFAKVDEEKRLVSGWATLDNIDTQGDIVLAEASAKAFARARGNIREMHQPLAVGRMIDFREDEFYDPQTKKFYRGIFVTARVSQGAEDTWQKVLDGTLQGFSIGGEINKASNEFVKEAGRTVRFIEDYDLVELSLVDNPANQLANVDSFAKNIFSISTDNSGHKVVKGMAVETKIENVFICTKHEEEVITISTEEAADCPECGSKMENAGWFESGEDRADKVDGIVAKFLNPADKEAAPISNEGGVDMGVKKSEETAKEVGVVNPGETFPDGEKIEESDQTSVPLDEDKAEEIDEAADTEEEEGKEPADSPEEVEDDESQISKKIDELHTAVKESLESSKEETLAKVADLESKLEENRQEFMQKFSEIESKVSGFDEKFEAQKARLSELESSLEKMNRSDAFRKSADLAPAEPVVQKDKFWGGAFSD